MSRRRIPPEFLAIAFIVVLVVGVVVLSWESGADPRRTLAEIGTIAALAEAGQTDEAERRLLRVLESQPENAEAHLLMAQILLLPLEQTVGQDEPSDEFRVAQAERALEHLERVNREDPDIQAVHSLYLGKANFHLDHLPEAESSWLEALRLDPKIPEAGWALLDLYYMQGRADEGRRLALRLHQTEPDPNDRVELLLELVRQDAQPLAPGAVVEEFGPIAEAHPEDLASRIALGLGQVRASQVPDGLATLRGIVEQWPESTLAWDALLTGLDDAGEAGLLVETLDRLPESLADDPRFHVHRGRAAQAQGDWDAAIAAYQAAFEERPDDMRLLYRLRSMLRNAGRTDGLDTLGQAIATYEAASDEVRLLYEEANAIGQHGIAEHHTIYLRLADQRRRMGRLDEARAWYRLVLELVPDNPEARAALEVLKDQDDVLS